MAATGLPLFRRTASPAVLFLRDDRGIVLGGEGLDRDGGVTGGSETARPTRGEVGGDNDRRSAVSVGEIGVRVQSDLKSSSSVVSIALSAFRMVNFCPTAAAAARPARIALRHISASIG